MCKEYNGWENYQTWVTYAWLTNDEGSYTWARETVRAGVAAGDNLQMIGDGIQEDVIEYALDIMPTPRDGVVDGLYTDLLTDALHSVYWRSIAKAFAEEE